MSYQTTFKRYEYKYLLTTDQKNKILQAMEPYMKLDSYGRTTIRNIYYDTDSYLLIRKSIESPVYKEKLRVRSYTRAQSDTTVFVELKKKYDSIVYKRRLPMKEADAMSWLNPGEIMANHHQSYPVNSQISREISYFLDYYQNLHPKVFLSYEREAYFTRENSDFRVTFDENILFREDNLSLQSQVNGYPLLPESTVLMEIKCSGGIPLWMVNALSQNEIRKCRFSKYGTAYKNYILPNTRTGYTLPEKYNININSTEVN